MKSKSIMKRKSNPACNEGLKNCTEGLAHIHTKLNKPKKKHRHRYNKVTRYYRLLVFSDSLGFVKCCECGKLKI